MQNVSGKPKTAADDILPHHIHIIASMVDHPSIYMGGPSRGAIRKAEKIWEALETEGFVTNAA